MQMLFVVCFALVLVFHGPARAALLSDQTTVFEAGKSGTALASRPYVRLPSLVATPSALLAFCEGRADPGDDAAEKEIYLSRSTDGGASWSAPVMIADDGTLPVSNPTAVYDAIADTVFLFYATFAGKTEATSSNPKIYMRRSTNRGLNWSAATEMTSLLGLPDNFHLILPGPGHGIQMKYSGTHAGRLLIPFWGMRTSSHVQQTGVIYSDDHGETWSLGGREASADSDAFDPNETQLVELSSGWVMKISRAATANAYASGSAEAMVRVTSRSSDGGVTFSPMVPSALFTGPIVEGGVLSIRSSLMAFTSPSNNHVGGTSTNRKDLVVRFSQDNGNTWKYPVALPTGPAEYTSLAVVDENTLGVLAELQQSSGLNSHVKFFTVAIPSATPADAVKIGDAAGVNNGVYKVWKPGSTQYVDTGVFDIANFLAGSAFVHAYDAVPYLLTNNRFTLNLWYRSGNFSGSVETLLSAYGIGTISPGYGMWLRMEPSVGLKFSSTQWPDQGTQTYTYGNAGILNDNAWHMISIVRTDDKLDFYVDKVNVGSVSGFFKVDYVHPHRTDYGLLFGARPTHETVGFREHFNGGLDEVRVYHRALSPSELNNLFINVSPSSTSLRLNIL